MFVRIDNPEKLGQFFFRWNGCLFLKKISVLNKLLGVTEKILKLPQLSELLVDPCKSSPKVCHIGIARTNMPKAFLHWKDCLFFQKFFFTTTC